MKKESKKEQNFRNLLTKIYKNIKDKKFRDAVAMYYQIDKEYKTLSENKKTEKLKKDMSTLYKELGLYLRINEAYVFAQEGDVGKLRKELEAIHDSVYDLDTNDITKPLFDYVTQHYSFCLDIYTYKASKQEFEEGLKKTQKLIERGRVSLALKNYSQLLVLYNKMSEYLEEDEKIKSFYKIKELFKHISVYNLIKNPKKKSKTKEKQKEIKEVFKQETPKIEKNIKFKDDYEELHDL